MLLIRIRIYWTIILSVILYACETFFSDIKGGTWTVFENKCAEENIWTKENVVTGGWRKLHNKEMCHIYSSPSIMRTIKSWRMRCVVHVA
jgi:hypothetical protein